MGVVEHLFCHHLGSFKSGKFVLLARVGHFIPCRNSKGETEKKKVKAARGDFLVLHPRAWGLPGPGSFTGTGCISKKLRYHEACILLRRARATGSGRSPGCHPRGGPCLARLHTALSTASVCPTRPGVSGAGQQMRVRRCHGTLACARDQLEGRRWGSVRDRWLCQIWLPGKLCKTHCAWRACREAWAPGWPGAARVAARPRATRQCYGGPVGGARGADRTVTSQGPPEPFLICPCRSPSLTCLSLLTPVQPGSPSLLLLVASGVAAPGPLCVQFLLPEIPFVLVDVCLVLSLPPPPRLPSVVTSSSRQSGVSS